MALNGDDTNNHFDGTIFDDEIFGFGGSDFIGGSPGADTIDGGDGIGDIVSYFQFSSLGGHGVFVRGRAVDVDLARDVQFGGFAEGDVLINVEHVFGSDENDTIRGDAADNRLFGLSGDDTLEGRGGGDVLFGDEGNDLLVETVGRNRLDGGDGIDTVSYLSSSVAVAVFLDVGLATAPGSGRDQLANIENAVGSTCNDILVGSSAVNVLTGGFGNDVLQGREGADTLNGGNGNDTASYELSQSTVVVDLALGTGLGGDATNDSLISIENLIGSAFNDVLLGDALGNILEGGGGADILTGLRGVDMLSGGSGGDRFVWRDSADSGTSIAAMDRVVDFDPLAGDRIDLSGVDANVFAAGNQAFTFIGAAAFSGTPGEINFVQLNGETIIQLQTGVSGDIEMGIRITGIVTPEASWFVL